MARYRLLDADFALAPESGDEELPAPVDLDPPWLRRARRPLYVAAVALGLALVALRIEHEPAAPATRAAPNAPVVVEAPVRAYAMAGLVSDDLVDACPAGASCRTTLALTPAVAAALTAAFPGYADPSARTVTVIGAAGTHLLGRFVHASTDTADITVQVLPRRAGNSVVRTGTGTGAIVVVQRELGTLTVRVTVGGEAASDRPGAAPLRLATDARLVTLP